jgi:SprT protein
MQNPLVFMENKHKEVLGKYLPDKSVFRVFEWIVEYKIQFRISRSRTSKLGDYRAPFQGKGHRISVNHDLNPYDFLITFVHEMAHLLIWEKYKNKVNPHGEEWKIAFRELMGPFLDGTIFPLEIENALKKHLQNAKASSGTDTGLSRILKQFDNKPDVVLEQLPVDAVFAIENGKVFKKGEKLRTRYRCLCLNNNRMYYVNAMAKVVAKDDLP